MSSQAERPRPADLSLHLAGERGEKSQQLSPGQPLQERLSAAYNLHGIDLSSFDSDLGSSLASGPIGARTSSLSPPASPALARDDSKTFLSTFKSRGPPVPEKEEFRVSSKRADEQQDAPRPGTGSLSNIYHLRKNPGSTPELNLVGSTRSLGKQESEVSSSLPTTAQYGSPPKHSEDNVSIAHSKRKDKVFRNPLARSKSIRRDSSSKPRPVDKSTVEQPPRTAPLQPEWSEHMFLRPKTEKRRGKSAERAGTSGSDNNTTMAKERIQNTLMNGGKQVISKAKTGGGIIFNRLGKMAKSTNHEKEVPDSEYVMKIIVLPLVEQTRITRISPSLDSCRDKTEFWMPSLPWRCIDYLNLNCEHEGLYRVPGSAPEVKRWQRRFDSEVDVDLLDETELYDPNTIASMLKSWLRDLPSEIMPKPMQHALGDALLKDNPDFQNNFARVSGPVPQILRNALSQLPPFNYYLLFAITCHLSLLLSHREKNKMDLNNLSICIGPPLNLERWLFNYLVGDWRNCWQGCFTEKAYHAVEDALSRGEQVAPLPFPGPDFDFSYGPEEYARDNETAIASRSASENGGTNEEAVASGHASEYEDARSSPPPQEGRAHEHAAKTNYTSAGSNILSKSNGRIDLPDFGGNGTFLDMSDITRPTTSGHPGDSVTASPTTTSSRAARHKRSHSDLPPSVPPSTTGATFNIPSR